MGVGVAYIKYFAIPNSSDQHINQQVRKFFARKTSACTLDGLTGTA
jgi:hypothetical protein